MNPALISLEYRFVNGARNPGGYAVISTTIIDYSLTTHDVAGKAYHECLIVGTPTPIPRIPAGIRIDEFGPWWASSAVCRSGFRSKIIRNPTAASLNFLRLSTPILMFWFFTVPKIISERLPDMSKRINSSSCRASIAFQGDSEKPPLRVLPVPSMSWQGWGESECLEKSGSGHPFYCPMKTGFLLATPTYRSKPIQ